MKQKHIIYTTLVDDSDLVEQQFNLACNDLDIDTANNVVCFADLGLWNGRFRGFKVLSKFNIAETLNFYGCDDYEFYIDENNEYRCTAYHHDGTNYYWFRELKKGYNIDKFEEKMCDSNNDKDLFFKNTKSLGKIIVKELNII